MILHNIFEIISQLVAEKNEVYYYTVTKPPPWVA